MSWRALLLLLSIVIVLPTLAEGDQAGEWMVVPNVSMIGFTGGITSGYQVWFRHVRFNVSFDDHLACHSLVVESALVLIRDPTCKLYRPDIVGRSVVIIPEGLTCKKANFDEGKICYRDDDIQYRVFVYEHGGKIYVMCKGVELIRTAARERACRGEPVLIEDTTWIGNLAIEPKEILRRIAELKLSKVLPTGAPKTENKKSPTVKEERKTTVVEHPTKPYQVGTESPNDKPNGVANDDPRNARCPPLQGMLDSANSCVMSYPVVGYIAHWLWIVACCVVATMWVIRKCYGETLLNATIPNSTASSATNQSDSRSNEIDPDETAARENRIVAFENQIQQLAVFMENLNNEMAQLRNQLPNRQMLSIEHNFDRSLVLHRQNEHVSQSVNNLQTTPLIKKVKLPLHSTPFPKLEDSNHELVTMDLTTTHEIPIVLPEKKVESKQVNYEPKPSTSSGIEINMNRPEDANADNDVRITFNDEMVEEEKPKSKKTKVSGSVRGQRKSQIPVSCDLDGPMMTRLRGRGQQSTKK